MSIYRRPEYIDYFEAVEKFTKIRKEMNNLAEKSKDEFLTKFNEIKDKALLDPIYMDVLSYYYKRGVPEILPENYELSLEWELVSCARGNRFAIEKMQVLIGFALETIYNDDNYSEIEYKNDIDENVVIYVLSKALCKIIVKNKKIFPIDLVEKEDVYAPYKPEDGILFRKLVEDSIQPTIDYLRS